VGSPGSHPGGSHGGLPEEWSSRGGRRGGSPKGCPTDVVPQEGSPPVGSPRGFPRGVPHVLSPKGCPPGVPKCGPAGGSPGVVTLGGSRKDVPSRWVPQGIVPQRVSLKGVLEDVPEGSPKGVPLGLSANRVFQWGPSNGFLEGVPQIGSLQGVPQIGGHQGGSPKGLQWGSPRRSKCGPPGVSQEVSPKSGPQGESFKVGHPCGLHQGSTENSRERLPQSWYSRGGYMKGGSEWYPFTALPPGDPF
jgi:hypothetical protein